MIRDEKTKRKELLEKLYDRRNKTATLFFQFIQRLNLSLHSHWISLRHCAENVLAH